MGRIIKVAKNGWGYEADQRHSELIIQETGAERLSTLTQPGCDKKKILEEEVLLTSWSVLRPRDSERWLPEPTI